MIDDEQTSGLQLPDGTLLEGIVTTLNEDGSPHIALMGPIVNADFTRLLLRPFRTSTTYKNLKRTGQGVLHVTDDVEMFARAAVGQLQGTPRLFPAKAVKEPSLRMPVAGTRSASTRSMTARNAPRFAQVLSNMAGCDFFGFNRAKHAVIEAAILATRIGLLDAGYIRDEYARLSVIVDKTGGHQEHAALEFLREYVGEQLTAKVNAETTKQ